MLVACFTGSACAVPDRRSEHPDPDGTSSGERRQHHAADAARNEALDTAAAESKTMPFCISEQVKMYHIEIIYRDNFFVSGCLPASGFLPYFVRMFILTL